MATARYYSEAANPDGAFFEGVPTRDLTQEEYDALSEQTQKNIDAHPMYRKSKPADKKAEKPAEKPADKDKDKEQAQAQAAPTPEKVVEDTTPKGKE